MLITTMNTDIGPIKIVETHDTMASAPREFIVTHNDVARPIMITMTTWEVRGFKVKWTSNAKAMHAPMNVWRSSGWWKSSNGSVEHAIENIIKHCIEIGI